MQESFNLSFHRNDANNVTIIATTPTTTGSSSKSKHHHDGALSSYVLVPLTIYAIIIVLWMLKTKLKQFSRYYCSNRKKEQPSRISTTTTSFPRQHYQYDNRHDCGIDSCHQLFQRIRRHIRHRTDTISIPFSNQDLDEGNYQSWSVFQVAQWTNSKLKLHSLQQHQQQQSNYQIMQTQQIIQHNGDNSNNHIQSSSSSSICCCGFSTHHDDDWHHQTIMTHGNYNNNTTDNHLTSSTTTSAYHNNNHHHYHHHQEQDYYNDHTEAIDTTIQALIYHRIDGASLNHLTLDHLFNLGVPFGMAVHLMTFLEEIIPSHLETRRPHISCSGSSSSGRVDGDEEVLPSWYGRENNANGTTNHERNDGSSSNATTKEEKEAKDNNDDEDEEQNKIMSERAQQIMKDRFGMTLPSLRGKQNEHHASDENNATTRQYNNGQQIPIAENAPSLAPTAQHLHREQNHPTGTIANSSTIRGAVPPPPPPAAHLPQEMENLINTMPPHIRAVAARRPELVAKLLLEKQQQQQQQQQQQRQQQQRQRQNQFTLGHAHNSSNGQQHQQRVAPPSLSMATILETEKSKEEENYSPLMTNTTTHYRSRKDPTNTELYGLEMSTMVGEEEDHRHHHGEEDTYIDSESVSLLRRRTQQQQQQQQHQY